MPIDPARVGARVCATLLVFALGAPAGRATVNDDCRAPLLIPALPFHDIRDTASATTASTDPLQSCGHDAPSINANSVWYSFTAPTALTLLADTSQSDYETLLSVATGPCGALTELACARASPVSVPLRSGQTVLLEVTRLSGTGGGILVLNASRAAQAANDICDTPTVIPVLPFADVVDTTRATTSTTDPLQSCSYGTAAHNSNSVWYRYTAPADGMVTASASGSDYDTVLTAYRGTCAGRREIACGDDRITFPVTAGDPVSVEVTQFGSPSGGTLLLQVTGPPANDICEMSTVIQALPFRATAETSRATLTAAEPASSCASSGESHSVWYSTTALADGTLTVDTSASDYATVVAAYTGSCGTLTEIACGESSGSPRGVSFPVAAGQPVVLKIAAAGSAGGGQLTLNIEGPPLPPGSACATASVIPALPFSATASLVSAPRPETVPVPSCAAPPLFGSWYAYTPAESGLLLVDAVGSDSVAALAAYVGTCDRPQEIACNADANLLVPVTAGQTVLIESAHSVATPTTLMFNLKSVPALPNDFCDTAPTIVVGAPARDTVDIARATTSPSDPVQSCTGSRGAASLWYRLVSPFDGVLTADTAGSSYDTVLGAFRGACDAPTEIACNDNAAGLQSRVTQTVAAGQAVWLEVARRRGPAEGMLAISIAVEPNATPTASQTPMPSPTPSEPPPATPTPTCTPTPTPSRRVDVTATPRVTPSSSGTVQPTSMGTPDRLPTEEPTPPAPAGGCSMGEGRSPELNLLFIVPAALALLRLVSGRRRTLVALLVTASALYGNSATAGPCAGDCDLNGEVTSEELATAEALGRGEGFVDECPALDLNGDAVISADEVGVARDAFANGCLRPAPVAAAAAPPSANAGLPLVADLNGDDATDLVVVDANGDSISIFLGSPAGLPPRASLQLSGTAENALSSPSGVALDDFNGDGITDIAVTNFTGASVSVFLGNGDPHTHRGNGSFAGPTNVPVPVNPLRIVAAKFRGPAAPVDLAVLHTQDGPHTRRGGVTFLRGTGDGQFEPTLHVAVGVKPRDLAVHDFGTSATDAQRDGNLDVAVTLTGEDRIAILYGDGLGTLSPPDTYGAGALPDKLAVLDVNQDACADLATTHRSEPPGDHFVAVNLGACSGSSGSFFNVTVGARSIAISDPSSLVAVQLNADAKLDLAVTDTAAGDVLLLANQSVAGTGFVSFDAPAACAVANGPQAAAVGDFNGDGIDDIAVVGAADGGVSTLRGTGAAPLCAATRSSAYR